MNQNNPLLYVSAILIILIGILFLVSSAFLIYRRIKNKDKFNIFDLLFIPLSIIFFSVSLLVSYPFTGGTIHGIAHGWPKPVYRDQIIFLDDSSFKTDFIQIFKDSLIINIFFYIIIGIFLSLLINFLIKNRGVKIVVASVIALASFVGIYLTGQVFLKANNFMPKNFDECSLASGTVLESFPPQCNYKGKNFTQIISGREKLTGIDFIIIKYPELSSYSLNQNSLQTIKKEYSEIDDSWYFAFIQNGSGRPIISAKCFRVDNEENVTLIGEFNPPVSDNRITISPISCK